MWSEIQITSKRETTQYNTDKGKKSRESKTKARIA